jgi:crotonobetainyl-CoA:carnitine CoA-transferase CaiB-like acyl-CoA transferase
MDITGEPNGPPTKSGLSLVDFSGGFVGAIALLAGIHCARRDGRGMDCDLSLFDVAVSLLGYIGTWTLHGQFMPARVRHSGHPSLVPFQNFRAADGWIVVGCAKEKFWSRLAAAIERPELANDPRFSDFEARRANKEALIPILEATFACKSCDEWIEILESAGVPCGPVNTVRQALEDPQTEARGVIVETEVPSFGTVRQPVSPARVGATAEAHRRAPRRHEDAAYVLGDLLGYDDARIERLEQAGAFGDVGRASAR